MIAAISADEWNSHIRFLRSRYPIAVKTAEGSPPVHSWMITPVFSAEKKRWTATVRAGSVNGQIATMLTQVKDIAEETKQYLLKTKFITEKDLAKSSIPVPLDFEPFADIPWREIGGSADPLNLSEDGGTIKASYEKVPAYFKKLGVPEAGKPYVDPATGKPATEMERRLFACDVVLTQWRTALTNLVSVAEGGLLGGSIVSVNPGSYTPPDAGKPPKVSFSSRFVYQPTTFRFEDIFFQRFSDEAIDQLHLSTIYALSPPKGTQDFPTFVNDQFEIMTRYYVHYNLAHATRTTVKQGGVTPQTLYTGLAAGLGDVMFNYILAQHNDWAKAVADLYGQLSLRGSFWVV